MRGRQYVYAENLMCGSVECEEGRRWCDIWSIGCGQCRPKPIKNIKQKKFILFFLNLGFKKTASQSTAVNNF